MARPRYRPNGIGRHPDVLADYQTADTHAHVKRLAKIAARPASRRAGLDPDAARAARHFAARRDGAGEPEVIVSAEEQRTKFAVHRMGEQMLARRQAEYYRRNPEDDLE